MKNYFKNILIYVSMFVLVLFFGNVVHADPISDAKDVRTYTTYLENYSAKDAIAGGISSSEVSGAVKDSKKQLAAFNALSQISKIEYVHDLIKQAQDVSSNNNDNIFNKDSISNDVVTDTSSDSYGYSSKTKSRSTQYTVSSHFKNLPSLTKFFIKVNYKTKGKKVLHTTSAKAYVVRNWNLFISYSKVGGVNRHVTQNQGYATQAYHARVIAAFKGFKTGIIAGTVHTSVAGNYKGYRSYTHAWWRS